MVTNRAAPRYLLLIVFRQSHYSALELVPRAPQQTQSGEQGSLHSEDKVVLDMPRSDALLMQLSSAAVNVLYFFLSIYSKIVP